MEFSFKYFHTHLNNITLAVHFFLRNLTPLVLNLTLWDKIFKELSHNLFSTVCKKISKIFQNKKIIFKTISERE